MQKRAPKSLNCHSHARRASRRIVLELLKRKGVGKWERSLLLSNPRWSRCHLLLGRLPSFKRDSRSSVVESCCRNPSLSAAQPDSPQSLHAFLRIPLPLLLCHCRCALQLDAKMFLWCKIMNLSAARVWCCAFTCVLCAYEGFCNITAPLVADCCKLT